MRPTVRSLRRVVAAAALLLLGGALLNVAAYSRPARRPSAKTRATALFDRGRRVFRMDTFGDEPFWSGTLKLDKVIAGAKHGGIGPGLTPKAALAAGLKVDSAA